MEHIILDWKKIYISKGLTQVFIFLSNIEKEVGKILDYNNKIKNLQDITVEMLWLLKNSIKLLNSKGIKIPLPQDTKITEKYLNQETFNISQNFIRSNMILIFSYIETLFCIITAYTLELDQQEDIVYSSKNKLINNIEKYLIGKRNSYFMKNKEKLWKLTAKSIQKLRNWLVHFYSVYPEDIALSEAEFKKTEKITIAFDESNVTILSSTDLFELAKVWSKIFIQELAYDFKHNKSTFNKKIEIVKKVTKTNIPAFIQLQ